VRLGQNDCLQGEKEIRKEISDLSYFHNIHKVRLFTKYESHMIVSSQAPVRASQTLADSLRSSDVISSARAFFSHPFNFPITSKLLIKS